MATMIELLKAYRDNRLVAGSPRRYTTEDGSEILAPMQDFFKLMKLGFIAGVSDYKCAITDAGQEFLNECA